MALEKQRGSPCAHCGAAQATLLCPDCRLQVCPACRDDRRRCPEPRPARRSLGPRARVLDVDSSGRYVLFVSWYGTCGIFDLAAGEVVKPSRYHCRARARLARRELRPRAVVLASGTVASISGDRSLMGFAFDGTRLRSATGEVRRVACAWGFAEPAGILAAGGVVLTLVHWAARQEGERAADYAGRSTVDRIDVAEARLVHRQVVESRLVAGAVCTASRLLALGSEGAVALHELETLEPLARLPLPDAAPAWIGLGEGLLATVAGGVLRVVRWADRVPGASEALLFDPRLGGGVLGPCHASLSPDGSLLAMRAPGGALVVLDLESGAVQRLPGSGDLELVRFVDGDRLISSSAGSLSVWQRYGARIAAPR